LSGKKLGKPLWALEVSRLMAREVRRKRIHTRIRKKMFGTAERPRVNIYRSLRNTFLQVIDDTQGHTLASVSTLENDIKAVVGKKGGNVEASRVAAEKLAERMRDKGIETVVFDRGGYRYHGRVKMVAETLRKAGIRM